MRSGSGSAILTYKSDTQREERIKIGKDISIAMATGTMRRQQIQSVSHFQNYNTLYFLRASSLAYECTVLQYKYNFTGYESFSMSFQYVPTVISLLIDQLNRTLGRNCYFSFEIAY
jgi:hypothetical protein